MELTMQLERRDAVCWGVVGGGEGWGGGDVPPH